MVASGLLNRKRRVDISPAPEKKRENILPALEKKRDMTMYRFDAMFQEAGGSRLAKGVYIEGEAVTDHRISGIHRIRVASRKMWQCRWCRIAWTCKRERYIFQRKDMHPTNVFSFIVTHAD